MSLALDLRHDAPALDFRVEVPEGRISALVGPSGSGKTSILRAIAGLLRLRHEKVSYAGEAWSNHEAGTHVPTRMRPIGLVPQQYGLFPHLTVQGNVETSLLDRPAHERAIEARHYIALAHIEGLEARFPHELSGGQRQRAALARAIARKPRLLLLDEPFSAVDRSTRKRLYVELRRLHEQLGVTILLVTHDLEEAAQLASHLCLLRRGRMLQSGPVAEVLNRPRSVEAARLLDIPNIFEASLACAEGTPHLKWGSQTLQVAGFAANAIDHAVSWAILPTNVLLMNPDKPMGTHLENPVPVRVVETVELGGETLSWLEPAGLPGVRLQIRLPTRATRRHRLEPGRQAVVCLRPSDIIALERRGQEV